MEDIRHNVNSFIKQQNSCMTKILKNTNDIVKIINLLIGARNKSHKIFTMGNGGSGSTASHFVSDLLKTAITKQNKRFQAISLVDNIPVLLAWSNDVSYDNVFVEQLKNYLSKGDIVIVFSGSGNSKNVISALKYAKKNGAFCIGLTGKSGGMMAKFCGICLKVPSSDMLTIESQHLTICHCIITAIRNTGIPLFKYD